MLLKQTKIVTSISNRRCDVDSIKQLLEAGMNMARMNATHASRRDSETLIINIHAVPSCIAILVDTKGPEVRTTADAGPIPYKAGDKVKIVGNPDLGATRKCIAVSYPDFVSDPNIDGAILINDGDLELEVIGKTNDCLLREVKNDATLGGHKSVNVPGVRINLPLLTERDRNSILYAIGEDIDFITHSFVRNRQDVLDIRETLDTHSSDIKIVVKIENQEGVDNIDEILEMIDGIMMAHDDLGIGAPQERIPGIQRVLIRKCALTKRPIIVATQTFHTIINNLRPTRAEMTDIVNTIYYHTGALMLNGETVYSKYPIEAVRTMTKIVTRAEEDRLKEDDIRIPLDESSNDVTALSAEQAAKATFRLKIHATITGNYSGYITRNLAASRGEYSISVIRYREGTMYHSALSYDVEAVYMPESANGQECYFATLRRLLEKGRLQLSNMVSYLSSGRAGTKTSFLEISVMEDALKRVEEIILPNNNRYL